MRLKKALEVHMTEGGFRQTPARVSAKWRGQGILQEVAEVRCNFFFFFLLG